MPAGSKPEVFIRPAHDLAEARCCAGFLVASEPRGTLGLAFEPAGFLLAGVYAHP